MLWLATRKIMSRKVVLSCAPWRLVVLLCPYATDEPGESWIASHPEIIQQCTYFFNLLHMFHSSCFDNALSPCQLHRVGQQRPLVSGNCSDLGWRSTQEFRLGQEWPARAVPRTVCAIRFRFSTPLERQLLSIMNQQRLWMMEYLLAIK